VYELLPPLIALFLLAEKSLINLLRFIETGVLALELSLNLLVFFADESFPTILLMLLVLMDYMFD